MYTRARGSQEDKAMVLFLRVISLVGLIVFVLLVGWLVFTDSHNPGTPSTRKNRSGPLALTLLCLPKARQQMWDWTQALTLVRPALH